MSPCPIPATITITPRALPVNYPLIPINTTDATTITTTSTDNNNYNDNTLLRTARILRRFQEL